MPDTRPDSPAGWTDRLRSVYDTTARGYDVALSLLPLVGFRSASYRRAAIDALQVRPGDTVLDIGCGTGRNLPLLAREAGENGRVIGFDVSSGALDRARRRTRGISNVELVQADALLADLGTPDRILATFSLSMMPDPEAVIARALDVLPPAGRFALLDFRIPSDWPGIIQKAAFAIAEPLGETWEMARRDLRPILYRNAPIDTDRSFFFGCAYVGAGAPLRS